MLQGGSTGASGRSAKFLQSGAVDNAGAKFGQTGGVSASGKSSITVNNSGLSPDLLTSLVGSLGQGQQAPPSAGGEVIVTGTPGTVTDASGSQPGQSQTSPYLIYGGIAAALLLLLLLKRK